MLKDVFKKGRLSRIRKKPNKKAFKTESLFNTFKSETLKEIKGYIHLDDPQRIN